MMKKPLPSLLLGATLATTVVTFPAAAGAATNLFTPSAANPPSLNPYCLEAYAYVDGATSTPYGMALNTTGYAVASAFQGSVGSGNCDGASAPEGVVSMTGWVEFFTKDGWVTVFDYPTNWTSTYDFFGSYMSTIGYEPPLSSVPIYTDTMNAPGGESGWYRFVVEASILEGTVSPGGGFNQTSFQLGTVYSDAAYVTFTP
jgi:hypothetical protein